MVEGYWGSEAYSAGVQGRRSLEDAPPELDVDIDGSCANSDSIYWGEACHNEEPVLVKDGSVEFENAPPANLLAYELFSGTEVKAPEVGYSAEEDEIYIKVLEGHTPAATALEAGYKEDFLRQVAAKALIGDPDFGGNVGKTSEGYALIDPDQAGVPINTFKEDLFDYLRFASSGTSVDISPSDFRHALRSVYRCVGENDLEETLTDLEVFEDDIPAFANFEPDFIMDNFAAASEDYPLSEGIGSFL
jgi:hypothetical protein